MRRIVRLRGMKWGLEVTREKILIAVDHAGPRGVVFDL